MTTSVLQRSLATRSPVAVKGDGLMLTLDDGRQVIDASGGAAVACLGHGDRRVVEAMTQQALRLSYAHTGFFTSEPAEALAELLVGHRPGGLSRALFLSSGSEAVEAAIKLTRQYFLELGEGERIHLIARRQSYHGATITALGVGNHRARRATYEPILPTNISHVSPCFAFHHQLREERDADYVARLTAELEAEFQRVGPHRVMAVCAETVVGATTGCVAATPGYFTAIRAVCERHGALLILDEVMCGMGRTGSLHAWQAEGIAPDIQVIGKSLGGGYQPIAALLISERLVRTLSAGTQSFAHGQTYQAHPVACAAALAVQGIIAEEALVEAARLRGEQLLNGLTEQLASHHHVADIRGRGLFVGVEFLADRNAKQPFAPGMGVSDRFKQAALEFGLSVYPGAGTIDGIVGDHVLLAPPFNSTPEQIARIAELFAQTVAVVFYRTM